MLICKKCQVILNEYRICPKCGKLRVSIIDEIASVFAITVAVFVAGYIITRLFLYFT